MSRLPDRIQGLGRGRAVNAHGPVEAPHVTRPWTAMKEIPSGPIGKGHQLFCIVGDALRLLLCDSEKVQVVTYVTGV